MKATSRAFGGTAAARVHIVAMLKAMAYGTELAQLGSWMSRLGIHHVGVSSANEGVAVRKTGADQDIFGFSF